MRVWWLRRVVRDGSPRREARIGPAPGAGWSGWSRRAVLGAIGTVASAGATGVLAGCAWFDEQPEPPPPPDPLEPLLHATRGLARRYDRVLDAADPELAEALRPIREAHRSHERALAELIGRPELATQTPASPPVASGPPSGGPDAGDLLAQLRGVEQAAAAAATEACLAAPAERAPLLGSIAAARATHAEVLA